MGILSLDEGLCQTQLCLGEESRFENRNDPLHLCVNSHKHRLHEAASQERRFPSGTLIVKHLNQPGLDTLVRDVLGGPKILPRHHEIPDTLLCLFKTFSLFITWRRNEETEINIPINLDPIVREVHGQCHNSIVPPNVERPRPLLKSGTTASVDDANTERLVEVDNTGRDNLRHLLQCIALHAADQHRFLCSCCILAFLDLEHQTACQSDELWC